LAQDNYNQWLQMGLITLEQALEFGNYPNGDALLQSIQTQKEQQRQMQEAQMQEKQMMPGQQMMQ
jgi:hypothetical protein